MELSPKQKAVRRAFDEGKRHIIAYGAARSGKSTAVTDSFVDWARGMGAVYGEDRKLAPYGLAARSDKQFFNNLKAGVISYCERYRVPYETAPRSNEILVRPKKGVKGPIKFVKLLGQNVSSVTKELGLQYMGINLDEAVDQPIEFVDQMGLRTDIDGAILAMTMNPKAPTHPIKVNYIDKITGSKANDAYGSGGEMDGVVFHFTWEDNPDHCSADWIAGERLKRVDNPHDYARFCDGLWYMAEGAIYPFFRTVVGNCPEHDPVDYYVSVDVSDAGKTHGLMFAQYPQESWCVEEYVHDGAVSSLTHIDQIKAMNEKFNGYLKGRDWKKGIRAYIADPKAKNFRRHLVEETGKEVVSWHTNVDEGIRAAKYLMTTELVHIDNRCYELITCFDNYVWNKKKAAEGTDEPDKRYSDGPDAFRGFCVERMKYNAYVSRRNRITVPRFEV